ncbi:MAG: RNA 2',3'-cyclic phosphodiesterase [Verrucomicrobiia bacterium]
MIRAFIAVDIPDDIRAAVADAQARLKRAHLWVKVSWTKPENWHLTLQFLGYVDEPVIEKISLALEEVARQRDQFDLSVRGAGVFPNDKRPRVLWVGCEDPQGKLKGLAGAVQGAMKQFRFEPEHREFSAHLTLGRVKPAPMKSGFPQPDVALTRVLDSVRDEAFGTMRVVAVHLFESQLHPQGSVYRKLSSHALRAA